MQPKRDSDKAAEGIVAVLSCAALALVIAGSLAMRGCSAAAQAAVYRREGIEMSTWEVFIGCRPAERTINVK